MGFDGGDEAGAAADAGVVGYGAGGVRYAGLDCRLLFRSIVSIIEEEKFCWLNGEPESWGGRLTAHSGRLARL